MPIIEKKTYRYEPLETKEEIEAKFNTPTWKAITEYAESHPMDINTINKELMAVENKDEILPSLTCQNCKKDLNPEKDKFYDSEDGAYCIDCMVKEEAKMQNLLNL